MQQIELIHESIEDAVREVARACGGTKALSQHLFCPAQSAQSAHTRFLDCLNEDRPAKFSPSELVALGRIGREQGCDAVARYLCAEMGYQQPVPLNANEIADELRSRIADGLNFIKANMGRLERLGHDL
jgi:hypothetical protein